MQRIPLLEKFNYLLLGLVDFIFFALLGVCGKNRIFATSKLGGKIKICY